MKSVEVLPGHRGSGPEVVLAHLFGWRAKGAVSPLSDYDLSALVHFLLSWVCYRLGREKGRVLGAGQIFRDESS